MDLTNKARDYEIFDKNNLVYTIMIRQPEFVDESVFKEAIEILKKKNNNPLLDEVEFVSIEEGMCVQMMHIGSFDEEYKSFEVMKKFCNDNNILIKNKAHREIYISDFRRIPKERLKTVLRYRVEYK
ncbi:MAG: GyrI-like domain-containing protein [Paraclostridium sordellii]